MSFDLLAPHYRWMEAVLAGGKLQRCRAAFLESVKGAQSILIVGEGHGRFLTACRAALPTARITCVDASQGMLKRAKLELARGGLEPDGIEFIHADALTWKAPTQQFDLIVTHFFLDCFTPEQLEPLIAKLAASARPKAQWLLADFQEPSSGWEKWRARWILASMYGFFRIATRLPARRLTPPDKYLECNGFQLKERQVSELGLLRSDWWAKS